MSSSVKVAVRVRPFNSREIAMKSKLIVQMTDKQTRLHKRSRTSMGLDTAVAKPNKDDNHDFTYDYSYWSFDHTDPTFVTQQQVYEDLGKDVIDCAFQGYNACVFAYGQTGSGKTYTMMGSAGDPGLIPRTCESLFERVRSGHATGTGYKTTVSYLEIYNEQVKDLLNEANSGHNMKIREHPATGPYVVNLSQHAVSSYEEIQIYIKKGNLLRTTACTKMNDTSSRSHAIFTITFTQAGFIDEMPSETVSKIHLVDLAGSERAITTGATGQRLKEGSHINKSLVTLGIVIKALAEQSAVGGSSGHNRNNNVYIPYRDSALTWLLKDSLGGNSKTIMIATISPAECNCTETLSTLHYANRAKNIINTPTVNEDSNVKLIRELREEIQKLKGLLMGDALQRKPSSKVFADLKRIEAQEKELTDEWTEKWSEIQSILREQKALGLRKYGAGVVLDSKFPHLIGIHDDTRTGVTLYSLQDGRTIIGNGSMATGGDLDDANGNASNITLRGDDILAEHCAIHLEGGVATIEPHSQASCVLNGMPVSESTRIFQGDFLLLGTSNMFRYNNPSEAARPKCDTNRLDLSRLSLMATSRDNLSTSMLINSEDEISFVCPLKEEDFLIEEDQLHFDSHPQHHTDKNQNAKTLSPLDVKNLKQLNIRERDLLSRKDMLIQDREQLAAAIEFETKRIRNIEVDLEMTHQPNQFDGNKTLSSEDIKQNEKLCALEDDQIQSELRLVKHTADLANLDDQLKCLEQDHYALILTRWKFENEALHLHKLNGTNMNHLLPPTRHRQGIAGHGFMGANRRFSVAATSNDDASTASPTEPGSPEHNTNFLRFIESTPSQIPSTPRDDLEPTGTSFSDLPSCCAMESLRKNIAFEKAKLMKNVEVNSEKRLLDEGIDRLHALQRQLIAFEKQLEYGSNGNVCAWHRDDDKGSTSGKSRNGSTNTSRSNRSDSNCSEYTISIPRYVVRGSGSSMHYEYEIAINLDADKWTILRRYSRIREMHLTMKRRYGDAVAQIKFPRRQIFFPQTESVAFRRRRLLEIYLRRLLVVCSKIPSSPIYEDETVVDGVGLQKSALIDFSSFFLRDVCECGRPSETESLC